MERVQGARHLGPTAGSADDVCLRHRRTQQRPLPPAVAGDDPAGCRNGPSLFHEVSATTSSMTPPGGSSLITAGHRDVGQQIAGTGPERHQRRRASTRRRRSIRYWDEVRHQHALVDAASGRSGSHGPVWCSAAQMVDRGLSGTTSPAGTSLLQEKWPSSSRRPHGFIYDCALFACSRSAGSACVPATGTPSF